VLAGAARAPGLSVTPMSLAEAVGEAGCIVHGTVTEVRSGRDERDLPATWVTVRVARMLKGATAAEVRFKQFGVAARAADGGLPMPFLPRYRTGSEVVLLLRSPSRHGFTSPVDASLGAYVVAPAGARASAAAPVPGSIDTGTRDRLLRTLADLVEAGR
jgi:hypothetical protein